MWRTLSSRVGAPEGPTCPRAASSAAMARRLRRLPVLAIGGRGGSLKSLVHGVGRGRFFCEVGPVVIKFCGVSKEAPPSRPFQQGAREAPGPSGQFPAARRLVCKPRHHGVPFLNRCATNRIWKASGPPDRVDSEWRRGLGGIEPSPGVPGRCAGTGPRLLGDQHRRALRP